MSTFVTAEQSGSDPADERNGRVAAAEQAGPEPPDKRNGRIAAAEQAGPEPANGRNGRIATAGQAAPGSGNGKAARIGSNGLAGVEGLLDGALGARQMDVARVQEAARELLLALGVDLSKEGVRETPRRMAATYAELLTPQPFNATTFPNDAGYDEMVLAKSIPFHSLCMHHLLPFHGVAHVGYLPGERILGLSKLARVVDLFARNLQVQERLTVQIADWLQDHLAPRGVGVVIEAEHMCMSLRGVQKLGARTVTSALHGLMRDDPRTRQEFLAFATER